MKTINIEELSTRATQAALLVIDNDLDGVTNTPNNPCGDPLAYVLHSVIKQALTALAADNEKAPLIVRFE